MPEKFTNPYKRARLATLFTQESAAEVLGLSRESLTQYENGKRVPPDEVVARMCEVYRIPWLALEHSSATDTLGVLPEIRQKPLPTATITLANRLHEAADRLSGLLRIAEDGVIDESERPEFDEIVAELRETIAAAYQVIYSADAKKERPETGISKRSRSRNPENHCKNSISHPRGNVKRLSREGAMA